MSDKNRFSVQADQDAEPSVHTGPKPKKNPKRKAIVYLGIFLSSIVLIGLLFSGGNKPEHKPSNNQDAAGRSSQKSDASATAARPLVPVNHPPSPAAVAQLFNLQQRAGHAAAARKQTAVIHSRCRREGSCENASPLPAIITGGGGHQAIRAPDVSTKSAVARSSPIVALSGSGSSGKSNGHGKTNRGGGFSSVLNGFKPPQSGGGLKQIEQLLQHLPHPKTSGASGTGRAPDRQASYRQFMTRSAAHDKTGGDSEAIPINPPMSGYVLMPGSIIPAVLVTTINSDLPGMIVARVRQNVYDSIHGSKLVIPIGSTLVGYYASKVFAGQTRVLSSFTQIIFPDGATVNLQGMSASDAYGQSGMSADVNNHYIEMFGASFLIAALSSMLPSTSSNVTVIGGGGAGALGSSGGTALNQVSRKALSRSINIPPTLIVHRGFRFNVMVNRPIRLGYTTGRNR